jgi:hypothetical protein
MGVERVIYGEEKMMNNDAQDGLCQSRCFLWDSGSRKNRRRRMPWGRQIVDQLSRLISEETNELSFR